jgi:hypothetical protein
MYCLFRQKTINLQQHDNAGKCQVIFPPKTVMAAASPQLVSLSIGYSQKM